jgi:hypothetical protein
MDVRNPEMHLNVAFAFEPDQHGFGVLTLHAVLKADLHDLEFIRQATLTEPMFQLAFESNNLGWPHLLQWQHHLSRHNIVPVDGEGDTTAHPVIAGNQVFVKGKESLTLWKFE